jgi:lysozyme family protein
MIFIYKLQPRDLSGREKPLYGPLAQKVEKPQENADIEANIKEFESRKEKIPKAEVKKFLEAAGEWEKNNNIYEIRRAGISAKENEKDPLIKHAKLSSAYLSRVKGRERPTYKVDFQNNELAEYKVGAGDILPPTVTIIEVNGERGFRSVNPKNGRIGYYNSEVFRETGEYEYIPVFTGDTITIIKTEFPDSPVIKRREIAEHVTLYQRKGPEPVELSEMTPAEKRAEEDLAKLERESKARIEKAKAKRGIAGLREEMEEGREGVYVGSAELIRQRRRVVEIARKYVGREVPEFRTREVRGGKLACAKVATTILQEAGYLDDIELKVDDARDALIRNGWRASNEPAEPGDVVIWAPTRRKIRRTQGALQIIPGHRHIGIALGPNWAVSNSSDLGMAREHIIYTGRRVEALLKPPGSRKGSGIESAKRTREKAEKERKAVLNRKTKKAGIIAADHRENVKNIEMTSSARMQMEKFKEKALKYRERYQRVSARTGIPWQLIAAIHYRESSMNFNTYLHNGDPLGKPTTHVPKGKLFYDWETAAIDALVGENGRLKKSLGLNKNTTDKGKMLAYAEMYNGLGYRNNRDNVSPYVYAGTNFYHGGMYYADGRYSKSRYDKRLGVAACLEALT